MRKKLEIIYFYTTKNKIFKDDWDRLVDDQDKYGFTATSLDCTLVEDIIKVPSVVIYKDKTSYDYKGPLTYCDIIGELGFNYDDYQSGDFMTINI